jgi:hypothetical protein
MGDCDMMPRHRASSRARQHGLACARYWTRGGRGGRVGAGRSSPPARDDVPCLRARVGGTPGWSRRSRRGLRRVRVRAGPRRGTGRSCPVSADGPRCDVRASHPTGAGPGEAPVVPTRRSHRTGPGARRGCPAQRVALSGVAPAGSARTPSSSATSRQGPGPRRSASVSASALASAIPGWCRGGVRDRRGMGATAAGGRNCRRGRGWAPVPFACRDQDSRGDRRASSVRACPGAVATDVRRPSMGTSCPA